MTEGPLEVGRMGDHQELAVAEVLAPAFLEDPIFVHVVPDAHARLAFLRRFMAALVRRSHRLAVALTLTRTDGEGLPVTLETSQRRNLPLYQRHGFGIVRELGATETGGPTVWTMRRAPVSNPLQPVGAVRHT